MHKFMSTTTVRHRATMPSMPGRASALMVPDSGMLPAPAHRLRPEQKHLLRITIILSALMSYVPDEIHWTSVAFSLAFGLLFLCNVLAPSPGLLRAPTAKYLLLFFAAVAVSFPNAMVNGVSPSAWLRGAIPFVFLSTHFFAGPVDDRVDARYLIDTLQIAAAVWAAKILLIAAPELGHVASGSIGRLTYIAEDTLIPYGLLGFVLSLFNPSPVARKWQRVSAAIFLFIIILCGYRSQLLICGVVFLIYLVRSNATTALSWILAFAVLAPVAGTAFSPAFAGGIARRFQSVFEEGAESRRYLEVRFAAESAMNNLALGNGLGAPVPIDAFDPGYNLDWANTEAVAYIHNVWFYFLMDLGVPGMLFFCAFVFLPLWCSWRSRRSDDEHSCLRVCAGVAIAALLAYTSCQAAFRGIQFNLMLATLTAVAVTVPPLHQVGHRR